MPQHEFFLSTERPLQIDAPKRSSGDRWVEVAHAAIPRPALVIRAGESVQMGDDLVLLAGSRLVLRYGPAVEAMSADGATLRVELVCGDSGDRIDTLAELPVHGAHGVRSATFTLDEHAGTACKVQLRAGAGPDHDPRGDWIAVYELVVAQEESLPRVAANAFGNERTRGELAHFATAYDHEMYHADKAAIAAGKRLRCRPLQALVGDRIAAGDAVATRALPDFPAPDDLPPTLRDPYHYTHHLLGQALRMRAPNFHERLHAMSRDREVRVLSLCSGAARIEAGMAALAGPAVQWTLMDLNESLLQSAGASFPEGVEPDLIVGNLNEIRDYGERYDVIMCVSGLHHIVELERVVGFIRTALADGGEFWSIGEAIGRNGNRLWGSDLEAANASMRALPARLRRNRYSGKVDDTLPDVDYSIGTFEGIRSQDITPLLFGHLDPVHLFRRNCFLWRLVDQTYNSNYDMQAEEDIACLQALVRAELAHFEGGGRPTELHAVFRKPGA
ncbi:class I SAM-dependent methyltransferase [Luteimonas sp. 8-5]|uniref:class I SAM-dependent methyltransferase n=1 Tax=Luteimonas sp. 8-5 TaxID=3039387 RepID=UPI0024368166|nr:class I SAM-dependent methyltransferase [Luteimonas sp. 8-5]MDG6349103.1 class I SAM-dependent methyltransferase [Luteimonas sp. 8-5]